MVERISFVDEDEKSGALDAIPHNTEEREPDFPFYSVLNSYESTEVLKQQWSTHYLEAYTKANTCRSHGDFSGAIKWFRHAQSIIYFVREKGVFSEAVPVREAACHYMIIQCYIHLQNEPSKVMRELYRMSEVFMDMLNMIASPDNTSELFDNLIGTLKADIANNHEIPIEKIYKLLVDYWKEEKDTLTEYQRGWMWKLTYFLTRYASIAFDFYSQCTPHICKGNYYQMILASIDSFSVDIKNTLSEEYINDDPEGVNQVYAKVHRNWMPIYADSISADAAFIVGDNVFGYTHYGSDYCNTLWSVINNFMEGYDNEIFIEDFEYALELLSLVQFANASVDDNKITSSLSTLGVLYEFAEMYDLHRITMMIRLYQARIARDNDDDERMLHRVCQAEDIYRTIGAEVNSYEEQFYEKWIKLLRAEFTFNEYTYKRDIYEFQQSLRKQANECVQMTITNLDECGSPDISDLFEIEHMFSGSITNDAKIDRQRGTFLPLEAQMYFMLGRVSVQKAHIYGDRIEKDPRNRDAGRLLLKTFYDARNYLCEAYGILRSMGYRDVTLLKHIAKEYRDLLDYNYTLSGVDHERKQEILPDVSESVSDMEEILHHYKIQRWTQVVFDAVRSYSFKSGDNYTRLMSASFEEGVRRIIPEVSRMYIVETRDDDLGLKDRVPLDRQEMMRETIDDAQNKALGYGYFYHIPGGKMMYAFRLDKGERRKMIIETDIELTGDGKMILFEVGKSIDSMLHLLEARTVLENNAQEFPEAIGELKNYVLKAATELFDTLFEVHPPTRSHSHGVAYMMNVSAQYMMNEGDGDINAIDVQEATFAGLLHDVGKLGLDPKLILDKASRLLPFEQEQVESHSLLTARVLRGLLGMRYFKNIIAVASSHHVKYGVDRGYPFVLPGSEVRNILPKLKNHFDNLTEEEYKFLCSEEALLRDDWISLAHDLVVFDQIQALRAQDRAYRDPMSLSELNGYLKSKSGIDFNPSRVGRIIALMKRGEFNHHLIHRMPEVRELQAFEEPDHVSWDDFSSFMQKHKAFLEHILDVSLEMFCAYLQKGEKGNLRLSTNCISRGLCDVYIGEEMENGAKDFFDAKEKGKTHFHQHEKEFFAFFREQFTGDWKKTPDDE
ncbi:hypothetical protein GF369_01855 [Candidatus Peregrinibacteria bacterium]|nr:hypothetical protein [Candidatus Peregrinibacteria bacterium]